MSCVHWYQTWAQNIVFQVMVPCSLGEISRRFAGTWRLSPEDTASRFLRNAGKMVSEYTVLHPRDSILHNYLCENRRPYKIKRFRSLIARCRNIILVVEASGDNVVCFEVAVKSLFGGGFPIKFLCWIWLVFYFFICKLNFFTSSSLVTLSPEDQMKHQFFHIVGIQQPKELSAYYETLTFTTIFRRSSRISRSSMKFF